MKKKHFFFFFFIFTVIIGVLIIKKRSPGFSLDKIYTFQSDDLLSSKSQDILYADCPFFYLAKGNEAYVFVSQDGKLVLKFFKSKHLRARKWISWLPGCHRYQEKLVHKKIRNKQRLFFNYEWAFHHWKQQVGLLYIHLHPTNSGKWIEVIDERKNKHRFPIDHYAFVIQQKADLIHERLAECIQKKDMKKLNESIYALFDFVTKQSLEGIIEADSGLFHNFGFINDVVIHFDIGRLKMDDQAKNPEWIAMEKARFRKKLHGWFVAHYPEIMPYVDIFSHEEDL